MAQYYNHTKGKTVLSLKAPEAMFEEGNRTLSLFICLDVSGTLHCIKYFLPRVLHNDDFMCSILT